MSQSKRQILREQRRRRRRIQRAILVSVIALGAILIGAVLIFTMQSASRAARASVKDWPAIERPMAERNATGDPNAPIKIVEYSDYQCPYCAQFAKEVEPLFIEYYVKTGKVYFISRSMGNFTSDNIAAYYHRPAKSESIDAAMAAYCAADQGKFWEMHDGLFANALGEDVGSFTRLRLTAIAEKVGLDVSQFKDCLNSGKYRQQAEQDAADGRAAGVNGTPSFVIYYQVKGEPKTQLIPGLLPFEQFSQALDAILAEIASS